ncbi:MAG: FAD:protein FMN transferase [Desulfuromonadaceae bacterium]
MTGVSRRYLPVVLLAAGCLLLLLWFTRPGDSVSTVRLEGKTMGTTWSALLGKRPAGIDPVSLQRQLQQQLDRINALMSTYDSASEVSRFNDSSSSDWFSVSAETAEVVELAQEISRLSDGAFDVTVGPLVDLWGFGPRPRSDRRPADSTVEAVRRQVGYRHLHVRNSPAGLRKDIPGLRIDLSAIAKGYAVDKLAETLSEQGVNNMVVEIGGEMRIKGRHPEGRSWQIAIEKPETGQRSVKRVLSLADTGLATSGNYRNFFVEDGQRYGHTIDPATGRPVRHRLASVTVLAPASARADALATALMALGDVRAQEFCRREKIAAYLLIHQGETLQSVMTDAFKPLVGKAAP